MRDSSWYCPEFYALLKKYNATIVMHDMQQSETGWDVPIGNSVYLRFHGSEERYRGSYSNEFLKTIAGKIKKWIHEGKSVYTYFNNTIGSAYENLLTLNEYVLRK